MKVVVLAENLNKALGLGGRAATNRAQLPILANVLFRATKDGLEISSTDLEVGYRTRVGAKVEVEGEISLPARVITELAGTLSSGAVELSVEKEICEVRAAGVKAAIAGISADEYPVIPEFSGKVDLEFEVEKLIRAVTRVGFASSRDDSRPVFTGVLLRFKEGVFQLVATDGYRLSMDEIGVKEVAGKEKRDELVMPNKVLLELAKIAEKSGKETIQVAVDGEKQQIIFKIGEIEVISRLVAGNFPPFEQIIPRAYSTRVIMDRVQVLEGVKRAEIFARENASIVKLKVEDGQLAISANGAQTGSSESVMEVENEGDGLNVAFNARYLLDYLNVANSEKIVLESEGSLKPGLFKQVYGETASKKGSQSNFVHVIMPVRVQE